MDISEFHNIKNYVTNLKSQKDNEDSVRPKQFFSLIPLAFEHKDVLIRDFLEVDGTFAVIAAKDKKIGFLDTIDLYTSVVDTIGATTYMVKVNEGLIRDLNGFEGFWIHFE